MDFRGIVNILGGEFFIFDDNDFHYGLFSILSNPEKLSLPWLLQENNCPRRIEYEQWLIDVDNCLFFSLFRMEKKLYGKLVDTLGRTDTNRVLQRPYTGGHFPVELKLQILIFLWYMATQDSLIYIGDRFKVAHNTVMKIVNRILYFILKLKKTYIHFPETEDEIKTVAAGFKNYPGVVGALDGTHIFIKVEKNQQDSYTDRYRRHSINIMAICESGGLFTYVFVGFPGSAHDSRVFESSSLFRDIEMNGPNKVFLDDKKYHLIGDSAFGIRTWLMTPYRDNNNLTRQQKNHNYLLSSERVKIEHAFGQLKGRWRRLTYINTYNICKTVEIATAACVLHNYCLLYGSVWTREVVQQERIVIPIVAENQPEGRNKRDRIANELYGEYV